MNMNASSTQAGTLLVLGGPEQFDQNAVLGALSGKYELVFARNIEEALDHLRRRTIDAVLSGTADPEQYPSAGVRPLDGELIFWADRSAASGLPL